MIRTYLLLAGLLLTVLSTQLQAAEPTDELIDHIAAVVNDDVILHSEVSRETLNLQQQAQRSGQQLPNKRVLQKRILERLIINRLQMQRASQTGISVDENTLNRAITSMARNNNLDLVGFRQALQKEGINYQAFRESIREELTISRLRTREVDSKVNIPSREIDSYLKRTTAKNELVYKLQHILIGLPEAASAELIQQAEAKVNAVRKQLLVGADFAKMAATHSSGAKALDGGNIGWRRAKELPDIFADAIVQLSAGGITEPLRSANGFHLLRVIETRSEDKQMATETRARHILLRDGENRVANEANRARLQSARERILAGEEFSELAKTLSDDTNSAANGGELPWFRPGEMVPEFEKVASTLPVGQISEPFRSSFGWHIVETLERRDYNPSAENRRLEAESTLKKARADQEYELWLRQLRAEAYVEIRDES